MRLQKPQLDAQNTRHRNQRFEGSLQGGQQPLHKGIIAVGLAQHPQAQQGMGVVGVRQRIATAFAGTALSS